MKMLAAALLIAAATLASAQAQPDLSSTTAKDAPICLHPFDVGGDAIDHTHVVDSRTILFYTRGGKVWKNTLRTPCQGLLLHGFSFLTREDEICSNAQSIRVVETGEVCQLGAFAPYKPSTAL